MTTEKAVETREAQVAYFPEVNGVKSIRAYCTAFNRPSIGDRMARRATATARWDFLIYGQLGWVPDWKHIPGNSPDVFDHEHARRWVETGIHHYIEATK